MSAQKKSPPKKDLEGFPPKLQAKHGERPKPKETKGLTIGWAQVPSKEKTTGIQKKSF